MAARRGVRAIGGFVIDGATDGKLERLLASGRTTLPAGVGDQGTGVASVGSHLAVDYKCTVCWGKTEMPTDAHQRRVCRRAGSATWEISGVADLIGEERGAT